MGKRDDKYPQEHHTPSSVTAGHTLKGKVLLLSRIFVGAGFEDRLRSVFGESKLARSLCFCRAAAAIGIRRPLEDGLRRPEDCSRGVLERDWMYKEFYHYKNFNSHYFFLFLCRRFDFTSQPNSISAGLSNGGFRISLAPIITEILRKDTEAGRPARPEAKGGLRIPIQRWDNRNAALDPP